MVWKARNPHGGAGWITLVVVSAATAEPVVLHDAGGTRPLAEYVPVPAFAPTPGAAVHTGQFQAPGPRFPVRTLGLVSGPVVPRAVNLPQLAGRPLFLVGSDAFSREWLARYRDRLRAVGAAGVVVQAETAEDFAAIRTLAQDLPLTAFDATDLARPLGLTGYPVLVSAERIEQ
jgi:integrating conjugative element protein (TIGR03765 family)